MADELTIEGYASLFWARDLNDDVAQPGCFSASLARTGPGAVRMLYQHEAKTPIGVWDVEPPLSEERETYLVEVLSGAVTVRQAEVSMPSFLYDAAMQAADFPSGTPDPLSVRARQGSAAEAALLY